MIRIGHFDHFLLGGQLPLFQFDFLERTTRVITSSPGKAWGLAGLGSMNHESGRLFNNLINVLGDHHVLVQSLTSESVMAHKVYIHC